jgi:hypothetical protein
VDANEVSEQLFGRRCRLPVFAWVAQNPKDRFFQSEVGLYDKVSRSNANEELKRLLTLGMLSEDRPDDNRRVYYDRLDSPLWDIVASAADTVGVAGV